MPSRLGVLTETEKDFDRALSDQSLTKAYELNKEGLNQLLRRCMLKVGIRASNLPTKEETAVLFAHIVKNYGSHTIAEIDLAFEMAITGRLELTDKEVNPYENFSCAYFSRIVNAYRAWSAQAFNQIRKPEAPLLQKPVEQYDWRGLIQEAYERYFKTDLGNCRLFSSEFYDQLVEDRFLPAFFYQGYLSDAKLRLCADIQLEIVKVRSTADDEVEQYNKVKPLEMMLIQYRAGERDKEVYLYAKQLAVWDLFTRSKSNEKPALYIRDNVNS